MEVEGGREDVSLSHPVLHWIHLNLLDDDNDDPLDNDEEKDKFDLCDRTPTPF